MTANIPDPTAFFRDLHTGIWQGIRQFFPADESQVGMLSTLAGDGEMRSARIFTDAGNLMFSINDIERGENLLVIASTYNEALSDPDDDRHHTNAAHEPGEDRSPVANKRHQRKETRDGGIA